MTCEEFRQITSRDPAEATRAEISGVADHFNSCESCNSRLHSDADEGDARLLTEVGPLAYMLLRLGSCIKASERSRDILADPECQ